MRATPKTSLPVKLVSVHYPVALNFFQHTITGEGAEGDVLLGGSGSLSLGGHCDGCWMWMEYRKEEKVRSRSHLDERKVGVCPREIPVF